MSGGNIYYNRLFGHSATELVNAMQDTDGRIITITFYDAPYYFLRLNDLKKDPDDVNPYDDISASGWYSVTVAHDTNGPLVQELQFLSDLGLAMQVGETDEYLINPIVDKILYGESGFFHKTASSPHAEEKFRGYMRDTVLPGYFLMYRYLTRGIYTGTHIHSEAQQWMQKISETIAMLNKHV